MALTLNPILLYLKADKVGQKKMLPVLDMISIFYLEPMHWEQPIVTNLFVCSSNKLILRHARQSCITMKECITITEMKERGWMFLHPSSFPCSIQKKRNIQLKIYIGKKCDILWMVNKKFRGQYILVQQSPWAILIYQVLHCYWYAILEVSVTNGNGIQH